MKVFTHLNGEIQNALANYNDLPEAVREEFSFEAYFKSYRSIVDSNKIASSASIR